MQCRAKKKLATYNLSLEVLDRLNAVVPKGDRSYWIQEVVREALDKIDNTQPPNQQ